MAAASLVRDLATAARRRLACKPSAWQPICAAMRAAATCSAITASWCWMAWKLPMARPNCWRCWAKVTVMSNTRSSAPTIWAAVKTAPSSRGNCSLCNARAAMVCAIGTGRAWRPCSTNNSKASASVRPAPPRSKGTRASRKPEDSNACHRASGGAPRSMSRTRAGGQASNSNRSRASASVLIASPVPARSGRAAPRACRRAMKTSAQTA